MKACMHEASSYVVGEGQTPQSQLESIHPKKFSLVFHRFPGHLPSIALQLLRGWKWTEMAEDVPLLPQKSEP